ncbi:hypothetical protein AH03_5 [Erwinia phage AH03]|uniref:Uncharacterized protein n=1 Tax=Erwinia phage AH03 TaxID=2869568 RepID=A0AAE7X1Z9_9CAUD|nr:hypothetical protein AH03_5 [Erwinia phage AH03]
MKVSIVEMIGMLQGKCLPRNIKVNESLAAYLVRQFEELHSERDALQEQVQKLAAENAAMKSEELVELLRLVECMNSDHCEVNYGHSHEWIRHIVARQNEYEEKFDDTPWGIIVRGSKYLATDAVIRDIGAKSVDDSDDKKRMDWLCAHCVEVRSPQMYGSHAMFHATQDSEEWDLPHHTTLREQVDAAIRAGEQP